MAHPHQVRHGDEAAETCPACGGSGEVPHACGERSCLRKVRTLNDMGGRRFRQTLAIYECKVSDRLWKIRHQYDPGTGADDIWLAPGEERRGYEFTEKEARQIREELDD